MSLSVVIPNYNHGHFLKELIPSLFSQSRPPDEVVIVDDGSTDDSVQIIEAFQATEKRIRLYKNGVNRGVVYSLNFAVSKAQGEWLTFPSADNFVLPGMYERYFAVLEKHPQASVCCSDPAVFTESTGLIAYRPLDLCKQPRYFSPEETIQLSARTGFSIGSLVHTIVVKKSVMLSFSLNDSCFIDYLKWHCDFFLFNSVAFRHGFCYLPETLSLFREAEQSYSRKIVPWSERRQVYENLLLTLNLSQNSDVKTAFRRSAILGEFSDSILRVLISNPRFYDYFTPRLSKRLFRVCSWLWIRKFCARLLPVKWYLSLKKAYYLIFYREKIKTNN